MNSGLWEAALSTEVERAKDRAQDLCDFRTTSCFLKGRTEKNLDERLADLCSRKRWSEALEVWGSSASSTKREPTHCMVMNSLLAVATPSDAIAFASHVLPPAHRRSVSEAANATLMGAITEGKKMATRSDDEGVIANGEWSRLRYLRLIAYEREHFDEETVDSSGVMKHLITSRKTLSFGGRRSDMSIMVEKEILSNDIEGQNSTIWLASSVRPATTSHSALADISADPVSTLLREIAAETPVSKDAAMLYHAPFIQLLRARHLWQREGAERALTFCRDCVEKDGPSIPLSLMRLHILSLEPVHIPGSLFSDSLWPRLEGNLPANLDPMLAALVSWQGSMVAHAVSGDIKRAQSTLRRSLRMSPQLYSAWNYLSYLLSLSHRLVQAQATVKVALLIAPEGPHGIEQLRRIETMAGSPEDGLS